MIKLNSVKYYIEFITKTGQGPVHHHAARSIVTLSKWCFGAELKNVNSKLDLYERLVDVYNGLTNIGKIAIVVLTGAPLTVLSGLESLFAITGMAIACIKPDGVSKSWGFNFSSHRVSHLKVVRFALGALSMGLSLGTELTNPAPLKIAKISLLIFFSVKCILELESIWNFTGQASALSEEKMIAPDKSKLFFERNIAGNWNHALPVLAVGAEFIHFINTKTKGA